MDEKGLFRPSALVIPLGSHAVFRNGFLVNVDVDAFDFIRF